MKKLLAFFLCLMLSQAQAAQWLPVFKSLWTPKLACASMIEWWDASNTSNITLNSGGVASWTGSCNGIIASQATSINQPPYSATALNGHPGMGVISTSTYLTTTTSFNQGPTYSVFGVGIYGNVSGTNDLVAADSTTIRIGQYIKTVNAVVQTIGFTSVTNYTATSGAPGQSLPALMYTQYDGSTLFSYTNGTAGTGTPTSGTPASGSETLGIGASNRAVGNSPWNGVWGDILLGSSNWSANLRQCVEGYEAWKYGVASSLPGGHPYKSSAPTTANNCT